MGKAVVLANQDTNWREMKDIYVKVLKEGWDIKLERVRENGSHIFKLTKENRRLGDLDDFQMVELVYRVLNLVEEE